MPTRCQNEATRYRYITKQVPDLVGLTVLGEGKEYRHSSGDVTGAKSLCQKCHEGKVWALGEHVSLGAGECEEGFWKRHTSQLGADSEWWLEGSFWAEWQLTICWAKWEPRDGSHSPPTPQSVRRLPQFLNSSTYQQVTQTIQLSFPLCKMGVPLAIKMGAPLAIGDCEVNEMWRADPDEYVVRA